MARIARLFVPLDVEFPTDDKIITAGPLASYLYICGLAYAKRSGKEGFIHATQVRFLAPGLTKPDSHAQTLEIVGLWESTEGGWNVAAWARHNLSGDQLAERKKAQRDRAIAANHARHHVAKGVKESDCDLCQAGPSKDQERSLQGAGMVPRNREGIEKGEGEEEGKRRHSNANEPSGSETMRQQVPAAAALEMLIQQKISTAQPESPTAYRRSIERPLRDEHRDAIAAYLERRPMATAEEIAAHVLGVRGLSVGQAAPKPEWYLDPTCAEHDYDGRVKIEDGGQGTLAPCLCRSRTEYPAATPEPTPPAPTTPNSNVIPIGRTA